MHDQRDMPECLNRRYKALDQLIDELNTMMSNKNSDFDYTDRPPESKDPGLKLMCDFWNILKEDPNCDIPNAIHHKMYTNPSASTTVSDWTRPQSFTCYMAKETRKPQKGCCPDPNPQSPNACCTTNAPTSKGSSQSNQSNVPLSKVLCNLKEAASFDKKCTARLNELVKTEKYLQAQIQMLESREAEGVKMLKQADCMWSCMEDAYKQKIAESGDRQKEFSKQLREVENSTSKWRKNKKDLESQLDSINKCHLEMDDKIKQKTSDIKCMDMEIAGLKKRIAENKKNAAATKKSLSSKKEASNGRIAALAKDVTLLQKSIDEQKKIKQNKEDEAKKYIKEAREDLQKLCRVLLQKKLENEDMVAEKDAMINEIKLLEASLTGCKERCKKKQDTIFADLKKVEVEIANYKIQCIRCHHCTDTDDIRKFCTDCPRCLAERDCLYQGDHCDPDHSMDCVCQSVKLKFLDNVFENMYTVLERQVRTGPGKAVANCVLDCLKQSRNGKLNQRTKDILQDFILHTIKNNLNLTIIGGAVKTRCELDPDTYKQLMLCLKKVKDEKPPKDDKGTNAKKQPCKRWGAESECYCPKGPKECACTKRAPPAAKDHNTPCPTDKEDQGQKVVCPHKDPVKCGPDCGRHATPTTFDPDLSQWRPDPCQGPSCAFSKDTRAAHIVIESDSMTPQQTPSYKPTPPYVPNISVLGDLISCKCGKTIETPCACKKERINQPRRRKIIEEVMGPYIEVPLIEKVHGSDSALLNKTVKNAKSELKIYTEEHGWSISDDVIKASAMYSPPKEIKQVLRVIAVESTIELFNFEKEVSPSLQSKSSSNHDIQLEYYTSLFRYKEHVNETRLAPVLVQKNNAIKAKIDGKHKATQSKGVAGLKIVKSVNSKAKEVIKDILKTDIPLKIISSGTKQIKADSAKDCDRDTCEELLSDFKMDSDGYDLPKVAEVQFESNESPVRDQNDIRMSSVQKEVLESSLKHSGTEPYANLSYFGEPEAFDGIAELKTSPSGSLVLDLSDNIIKKILLIKEEPRYISASFIETNSGRILLNFDPHLTDDWPLVKMKLHKTQSGRITLEIEKDLVKSLHKNLRNVEQKSSLSIGINCSNKGFRQKPPHSQHLTREILEDLLLGIYTQSKSHSCVSVSKKVSSNKKEKCDACEKDDSLDESNYLQDSYPKDILKVSISTEQLRAFASKSIDNYKDELLRLYECKGGNIKINVQSENDTKRKIDARITKTDSGHVALDLGSLSSMGEISDNDDDHPILLSRSMSGNYTVFIGQKKKAPNTVLRRNISGTALVVITEPVLKSIALEKRCFRSLTGNKAFKVKIKGVPDHDVIEPPALLKLTPSGNYVLVLDKEFEKQHSDSISKSLSKAPECFVSLEKTNSSTVLINFEDVKAPHLKTHALLVKSPSDTIKILVNGPMFENLHSEVNKSDSKKAFAELLSKIPSRKAGETTRRSSKELRSENEVAMKRVDIKASSDSQIYENVRLKLHNRDGLWTAPSASLQRTASGQYAVFLDKDSKKEFIKDVQNYLANSSQSTIPVTRTDSGEIQIDMTGQNKGQRPYERLKITPSGNIYIVVDEKTLKRMESTMSSGSVPIQGPAKKHNMSDKSPTTFCNAKPEECYCKPDKCVCKELLEKWEYDPNRYKFLLKPRACSQLKISELTCKKKDCDPEQCKDSCCKKKKKIELFVPMVDDNKSCPHDADMDTMDDDPDESKTPSKTEQCFYQFGHSTYPYDMKTATDRISYSQSRDTIYDLASSDRDTSSWTLGFDDDVGVDVKKTPIETGTRGENWDSTFFLEHQLPYFLRDYYP